MDHSKDMLMIRFGELSTKGKNIKDFIKKLGQNLKIALKDYPTLKFDIKHDHIYIHINDNDLEEINDIIAKVPGLSSFSLVEAVERDIEKLKIKALEVARENENNAKTFKIITKRVDKLFPMSSDEINRAVANDILVNTNFKVDVHNPELPINIIIRPDIAYIFSKTYKGIGGYPVGISGKGLMLLSGGIDSPVASYLMMKRGVKLEMIHFAAPPYTSEQVIVKIQDLIKKLNIYQPRIKVYVVPFTEIQKKIYEVAGTSYAITIMRRMMLRIAERTARSHHDLVLSTGESIGQVASQTLQSIVAIESACNLPIIRPLATMDKVDIIEYSKMLGTYDISIRPFEDCCTIFTVKDPTTAPNMERINEIESKFDFTELLDKTYRGIEVLNVTSEEEEF